MSRMTRTYAAKRLLEHGPMTMAEFVDCTGWGHKKAAKTIEKLLLMGDVCAIRFVGQRRSVYALA